MSRYSFTQAANRCLPSEYLAPAGFPAPSASLSETLACKPGKPRFGHAVASCRYYRQRATGTTDPRQGNNPTCFALNSVHAPSSACISGHRAHWKEVVMTNLRFLLGPPESLRKQAKTETCALPPKSHASARPARATAASRLRVHA